LLRQFLTDENNSGFSYFESFSKQNDQVKQGLDELRELASYLEFLGINKQCIFSPFLARSLEIYTGTIYEIFLSDYSINSSIGSGGIFDIVIGRFIASYASFSTVSVSFGLDVINMAMSTSDKELKEYSYVNYYIIPLGTQKDSLLVANYRRKKGYKDEYE